MYLKLAWRNIWRNKRRTFITLSSITFAVLFACIMRSMQLGSYERMIDNAARFYLGFVQVHQKGYWDDRTIDNSFIYSKQQLDAIDQIEGVTAAVPRLESFALASTGLKSKGILVMGIEPIREHQLTLLNDKIVNGKPLKINDEGALVAKGLAEYLKISVGDTLVMIGQGYHGASASGLFPVQGIIKFANPAQNDQLVYISLDKAQWFYDAENMLSSIALVVDNPNDVPEIVKTAKLIFDSSQYEVMDYIEMMPELHQSIELDNVSGKIMLIVLYVVIGFGMLGTFMMMTNERLYEFGIMMAVGMRRHKMQSIMILEMLFMTMMGVLLGILLSLPLLGYYHFHPIYFTGDAVDAIESFGVEAAYFFSLQASIFYNQAWAIFIMAITFSIYPLWVIHKLKIINAMKQ
jgi:putative ABC transport system permease protein